jgi:hypothetical protein
MDRRRRLALAYVVMGVTLFVGSVSGYLGEPDPILSLSTVGVALIALGSIGLVAGGIVTLVRPGYTGRLAIDAKPSRSLCVGIYAATALVVLGTILKL